MKVSLITTSIRIPTGLEAYARDMREHGHPDVDCIVVGERKSDVGISSFCKHLSRNGFPVEYFSIEAQQEYLSAHRSKIGRHLSFDSHQRRIVGMLKAWQEGADLVIHIDAKDHLLEGDFIGSHSNVGRKNKMMVASSSSGYFNSASLLCEAEGKAFFLRGFPSQQRDRTTLLDFTEQSISVAANAGFCLGCSDLDATTRLDHKLEISGIAPASPRHLCLAPGTWSPFPAHNLSLKRDVVPAYFLSPYVGRYDDIWASYIVSRIAAHLGEGISLGSPAVMRSAAPGNLTKELEQELVGYRQTDRFCAALRSIPLTGSSYHECFGQIAAALPDAWTELPKASAIEIEARNQLLTGMVIWHELIASILARSTCNLLESVSAQSPKSPSFAALSR